MTAGLCRDLLGVYRGLHRSVKTCWGMLSSAGVYRGLLGSTGVNRGLLERLASAEACWAVQGSAEVCRVLHVYKGVFWGLEGSLGAWKDLLGSPWVY